MLYGMQQKNDTNIRNVFLKCVCGAACTANRKGSSANRKASSKNCKVSPKMRKAFSEERWICTNIRFFQSCICVFRAVFVSAKQNSNGKHFHKCVSFLKTHTVCFFLPKRFLQSTVQPHQAQILERAANHIKVICPSLFIVVATMGKCKEVNNSNLLYVSDVISLIIHEILQDFANAVLSTLTKHHA